VAEWQAFQAHLVERHAPKTSLTDFRQTLEVFRDMSAWLGAPRSGRYGSDWCRCRTARWYCR
jgi:hypothetical protein